MDETENLCTALLKKESEKFDSNTLFQQETEMLTNRLHGWEHNTTTNILIKKHNSPAPKSLQPPTQSATPNTMKNYRFSKRHQNIFSTTPTGRTNSSSVKNRTFLIGKIMNSKGYLASRINAIRKREILKSCERNNELLPELSGEILRKNIIIQSILPDKFKLRHFNKNSSNLLTKRLFIESFIASGCKLDF